MQLTVDEIKDAIAALTPADKAALLSALNAQDSEQWDRQIEADFSEGGAGMELLEQWDAEIKTGASVSLNEFLNSPKKLQAD